jgi:Mg2+ and Co2+ transporter CorA
MLVQALIDAIIDLAIPVTNAYQDIIGELELSVLTEPSIKHTSSLYIVTSEVTKLRAYISPVINLINALRDHKTTVTASDQGRDHNRSNHSSVEISGMARTYLGDVEDHIILMTDSLDTMRRSCDNMIDLIFNTISAYQNESMKQLTVVTIIFLPLSFLTGYFGMNLQDFPSIHHRESYFWEIAIPVAFAVAIFLMKDMIKWYFIKWVQRRGISRNRKSRLEAEQKRK